MRDDDETSLMIMQRVEILLPEADTIQKVKEVKSLMITAAEWAKRRKLDTDAVRYAQSYALEAEKKMGEMLKATAGERANVGRPKNNSSESELLSNKPTLKDLGVGRKESHEAQMVADMPQPTLEAVKAGNKSRRQALDEVRKTRRAKNAAVQPAKPRDRPARKTNSAVRGKYDDWRELKRIAETVSQAIGRIKALCVDAPNRIRARNLCEALSERFAKLAIRLGDGR